MALTKKLNMHTTATSAKAKVCSNKHRSMMRIKLAIFLNFLRFTMLIYSYYQRRADLYATPIAMSVNICVGHADSNM